MTTKLKPNPDWSVWRPAFILGATVYKAPQLVLPWLPWPFKDIRDLHEYGHSWGIISCSCKSCIMYEGGDNFLEKLYWPLVLYHRVRYGEWFCSDCLAALPEESKVCK